MSQCMSCTDRIAAEGFRTPRRPVASLHVVCRQPKGLSSYTSVHLTLPTSFQGCSEPRTCRHSLARLCATASDTAASRQQDVGSGGSLEPFKVTFREVDTFNLWIWLEMAAPPTEDDVDLLDTVITSWFMIGRLGGYNSMNLQAAHIGGSSVSFMEYDQGQSSSALDALFHDMSTVESQGNWCRCWFDLGTADELGLDVLINALVCFSKENVAIKQLIIGGVNSDWPTPKRQGLI